MTLEMIHPILEMFGWALLNFLWQGTLLALLLFAINALARASGRHGPLRGWMRGHASDGLSLCRNSV